MKAAHLVHSYSQLSDPNIKTFDILVCNPSMSLIDLMNAFKPGAIPLGNFDATMLTTVGPSNPFYNALRTEMDPYILRDSSGQPVLDSEWSWPFFDWKNLEGARVYADWIADNWSGQYVYLDDCSASLPNHRRADIPVEQFDAADFYPAWKDALIARLIARGQRVVLNCAGWICPAANGICIEKAHADRMGFVIALARYAIQWTLGKKPVLSIDWSGRWEFPTLGIARGSFI